ncbi:hypothetical protein OV208_25535 [Corallococcus sp. bb12-1]|uniref:hypothetical protein n=1 Tax=Corallococcus sp. bb12-1 TaxID=2996784 RepID=UPI00226F68D2|nr:hypothetical protein [Corallococcus sp. bb12-1]MCY1044705.1 hypothetical protein [Corallococcus sp. bb12-1]
MRVKNRGVLVGLVLAGVGLAPNAFAVTSDEVSAQACPPGVASRVGVIHPPGASPGSKLMDLTDVQGTVYFTSNLSENNGVALWRSDGTEAGTLQLKQFPYAIHQLTNLVAVNDKLFFQFYEPNSETEQVWFSDKATRVTRFLKGFASDLTQLELRHATAVNGRLVFFRLVWRRQDEVERVELWSSDGTDVGTTRLRDFEESVSGFNLRESLTVGNALLFFRSQAKVGTTLWRTDGTSAGTTAVKSLDSGPVIIEELGRAGDVGLFVLGDFPNYEVWKTDGTEAGTSRLETFGRRVRIIGALGGYVFLASVDAVAKQVQIHRVSLDGGKKTLVSVLPQDTPALTPSVQRTAVSGTTLYLSVAQYGTSNLPTRVDLWALPERPEANRLRRLFSSLDRRDYSRFAPLFPTGDGALFFTGSSTGMNTEPWFTRGTVATTGQIADIGPGAAGSGTEDFTRSGLRIYFPARDDTGLEQLWSVPASFICPPGLSETAE